MDYFERYQIPHSLKIDHSFLQKKYYELCRLHHPDHFTLSDDISKINAEKQIAEINTAKKILENEYSRIEYLLKINHQIEEDEKFALSPAFLAEMMDINEQIMDLKMDPNDDQIAKLKEEINTFGEEIKQPILHLFSLEKFEANQQELADLKQYYFKKKYLNRILKQLD